MAGHVDKRPLEASTRVVPPRRLFFLGRVPSRLRTPFMSGCRWPRRPRRCRHLSRVRISRVVFSVRTVSETNVTRTSLDLRVLNMDCDGILLVSLPRNSFPRSLPSLLRRTEPGSTFNRNGPPPPPGPFSTPDVTVTTLPTQTLAGP